MRELVKEAKKMEKNYEREEIESFKCVRCGTCCKDYEVHGVPGHEDGLKPKGILCNHCEPAEMDKQGQWHAATCDIHETTKHPEECSMPPLIPSGGGPCPRGLRIWAKWKKEFPNSELPEYVLRCLHK